jgi:hypothetical protein
VGDTFGQEVTVTRASAFGTLGVVTAQAAEYTVASTLEVTAVHADGSIAVTQTVQAAKLATASTDLKDALTDALKKAVAAKFELSVGPTGKVTALAGLDDPIRVKLGRDAGQQTARLWSVLDADAWKELAGLTFLQPDKPGLGEKWSREFTHDWGPLGRWVGRTDYRTAGKPERAGGVRIDYTHVISHRPAKAVGNLPFAVRASAFPGVKAGGLIRYDPHTNRVTAAEELFHVRGGATVTLGGAEVTAEVEERQQFRVTVSEVKPRELVGRAPAK